MADDILEETKCCPGTEKKNFLRAEEQPTAKKH